MFTARPESDKLLARLVVDAASIRTLPLGLQPAASALAVREVRELIDDLSVLDGFECYYMY